MEKTPLTEHTMPKAQRPDSQGKAKWWVHSEWCEYFVVTYIEANSAWEAWLAHVENCKQANYSITGMDHSFTEWPENGYNGCKAWSEYFFFSRGYDYSF